MIRGVHTMFYTSAAEELRAFIRDKLGFPFTDVGGGWLIFDLPEADMGCHPAADHPGGEPGTHAISVYTDDLAGTRQELEAKGVEFTAPITDQGFGLVTHFRMPGGVEVQLYQPHYQKNAKR
jgi:predicted enzyme related to lactoylglutathione lyase